MYGSGRKINMVIQHNMQAMNGNRMLGKSTRTMRKSTEKLSSGYRINRAADDAAGLAISEKMRGQIRGLDRSVENVEDGISLVQTADGAMAEIEDMVHRMRELSVQAANDTNTTEDREEIQQEINQLSQEITRISDTTEFNTMKILKGSMIAVTRSKTGTIAELRDLIENTKKYDYIETMVRDNITATSGYTKNSLPDWVMGNDPLYPVTQTTATGHISEEIDLGEKKSEYYAEYADNNGNVVYKKTSSKSEYNLTSKRVTSLELVDKKDQQGQPILDSKGNVQKEVQETYSDGSRLNRELRNYDIGIKYVLLSGQKVSCNYVREIENITHNGGIMDFSNLSKDNISELLKGKGDHGFNASCVACDMRYSISFVNGSGSSAKSYPDSGSATGESWVYEIDIKALVNKAKRGQDITGKDLTNHIITEMQALTNTSDYSVATQVAYDADSPFLPVNGIKFETHHQALLVDPNNENAIIFIDTNRYGGTGIFEPMVCKGDETKTVWRKTGQYVSLDEALEGDPNKIYNLRYSDEEFNPFRIQAGANGGQELVIKLPDISLEKMGITGLDVTTHANAAFSIDRCTNAINYLNSERSRMGAYQNRMEHTVLSNENTSENLQASESRIRDTEMASEMAEYSKYNILQQAGQSVLAQANQATQGMLSLLQ